MGENLRERRELHALAVNAICRRSFHRQPREHAVRTSGDESPREMTTRTWVGRSVERRDD